MEERPAKIRQQNRMMWIPGGTFQMGSDDFYSDERPVHSVRVDGFLMDRHPVTNAQFSRFVDETGYITAAERIPDANDYPGIDPGLLVPGSLVFQQPKKRTNSPSTIHDWWKYIPGACWRHPKGSGSSLAGRSGHPVVHVAYEDALAYARWAGKTLPTEAEWEFAARGGIEGAVYAWGNEFAPGGRILANIWQGEFPWKNLKTYADTTPPGTYPANGYGLYDMTGNVWEWTRDVYRPQHPAKVDKTCCTPDNPRVTSSEQNYVKWEPDENISRMVLKGGSYLCAPNFCLRYRPAARQGQDADSSASHIGFRCIIRENVSKVQFDSLTHPSVITNASLLKNYQQ